MSAFQTSVPADFMDIDDTGLLEAAISAEQDFSIGDNISVVFDVDGCAIAFVLALLTDQASGGCAYVISYCSDPVKAPALNEDARNTQSTSEFMCESALCAAPTKVRFCLLNQLFSCSDGSQKGAIKKRIRPVFICDFQPGGQDASDLRAAILLGEPLSVSTLKRTLNEKETFALHDDLTSVLAVTLGWNCNLSSKSGKSEGTSLRYSAQTFPRGKRGLTALYIRYEQRVISAYRRVYGGSSTTAFWYLAKFGPGEKSLVLCTRYYLMQAEHYPECASYDLQAIKDLCMTYAVDVSSNKSGLCIQDLTSFAKLSKFCCSSGYARGAVSDWFPQYMSARVTADTSEVHALKGFIERDRGGLKISDDEFVKYIYLAYFECYNRTQLKNHFKSVTATRIGEDVKGKSLLGQSAVNGFFTHVRSQLNIKDYISANVKTKITSLSPSLAKTYVTSRTYHTDALLLKDEKPHAMWGCASQMARKLDALETAMEMRGWPRTIICRDQEPADQNSCYTMSQFPWQKSSHSHSDYGNEGATLDRQLDRANTQSGPLIVKRLLAISSCEPPAESKVSPIMALIGSRDLTTLHRPLPIYRTATARGRQLFCASMKENWTKCHSLPSNWNEASVKIQNILSSSEIKSTFTKTESNKGLSDAIITLAMAGLAKRQPSTNQIDYRLFASEETDKYKNRNEIFNSNLVVGNLILDVDMSIRSPIPYLALHSAMRGFRTGVITALRLMLVDSDVDWDAHPCYFYKSECKKQTGCDLVTDYENGNYLNALNDEAYEYLDQDWTKPPVEEGWEEAYEHEYDEEPQLRYSQSDKETDTCEDDLAIDYDNDIYKTACVCEDKIGMRVCVPMPRPYAIHGADTAHGFARVIQQAVLLERTFVESVGPYLKNYDIIDCGVYGHGKSLRMPFFGKISSDGTECRRLVPFYVIPERCDNIVEFIANHFHPNSFHSHALPKDNLWPTKVVRGLGGEYVSFFDRKTAMNRDAFYGPRMSVVAELNKRGVNVRDQSTLEAFVHEAILGDIEQYIGTHFPEHSAEYRGISATCKSVKSDWILFQITPKGYYGYRKQFTCFRYKHRRTVGDSVRTYLSLTVDVHGRLCASIGQQCFAAKCGSNKLRTLFTVDVAEQ